MTTIPPPTPDPAAPIERSPLRVRPPHRVPDARFDHLTGDAYAIARRGDKAAALLEPLAGLPLSDYERTLIVEHLAGADVSEVAVFVALLHRCRAAAPLARWSSSGSA